MVLEAVHERLSGVVIERLPHADLLARYDRPQTLSYLDPPYWGCEAGYGQGVFVREDFERLAGLLAGLCGRFLLSINDTPAGRRTFRAFRQEEVQASYGLSAKGDARRPRGELIVSSNGG